MSPLTPRWFIVTPNPPHGTPTLWDPQPYGNPTLWDPHPIGPPPKGPAPYGTLPLWDPTSLWDPHLMGPPPLLDPCPMGPLPYGTPTASTIVPNTGALQTPIPPAGGCPPPPPKTSQPTLSPTPQTPDPQRSIDPQPHIPVFVPTPGRSVSTLTPRWFIMTPNPPHGTPNLMGTPPYGTHTL